MREIMIVRLLAIFLLSSILGSCDLTNKSDLLHTELQEIIKKLDDDFFKGFCPKNITVKYAKLSNFGSVFNPNTNVIILSQNYRTNKIREERPVCEHKNQDELLAHEICHLALYNLTNHQSLKEQFRFLDEGLAEILGRQIAEPNELVMYKINSLQRAKDKIQDLSFKKVQKWEEFFGAFNRQTKNWVAYDIGSSFIFFIVDTYSSRKLYEFFISISKTGDLSKSIYDLFEKTEDEFEKEWKAYVENYSCI